MAPEVPGITDVEGGMYALMSTILPYMEGHFRYAAKVLGNGGQHPQARRGDRGRGDAGDGMHDRPGAHRPLRAPPRGWSSERSTMSYARSSPRAKCP